MSGTIRKNYCTNPSFEGTYSAGKAPVWSMASNVTGTVSWSEVAGRVSGSGQRIQYTGVGGDTVSSWIQVSHAVTPVGSFAPGDTATFSMYWKGSYSGVDSVMVSIVARQADDTYIAQINPGPSGSALGADWAQCYVQYSNLPALTSKVECAFWLWGWTTGDTCDVTLDDVVLENATQVRPYFDGTYKDAYWNGTAHASTSDRLVTATINDETLSIKLNGTERREVVHGMEWETTELGDGSGSFWMEPTDPFNPQADWTNLRHGATVDVTHTHQLSGETSQLYKGFVISDPRVAYAGETKRLEVECGGVAEVARWRTDLGFVYTDSDPDNWFENKYNPKWANVQLGDRIEISIDDGTKITYGSDGPKAAAVGYMPYPGFAYMLKVNSPAGPMNGARRIKGKVTYNLHDDNYQLRARLAWRSAYSATRSPGDSGWTTIKTWGTAGAQKATSETLDESFAASDGAGYLALLVWTTNSKGKVVDGDRFFRIDDPEIYTSTSEKRVDEAMLDVANYVGLHTTSSTSNIGSVVESLVARPPTDPVSALNTFASQADTLVEWGWFSYYSSGSKFQFRAKPMLTNPTTIRALDNCYSIDATAPGAAWDVRQRQEDGEMPRTVRVVYGRKGSVTWWPAGFRATAVAPKAPLFTAGLPFRSALAPVLTVDFSSHNYTDEYAKKLAKKLARYVSAGLSTGSCTLQGIDVHRYSSGTTWRPAAYIKGADWVECEQSNCGPLYVMRSHVDLDTETVELEVGISADEIIGQLEAAGGAYRHKYNRRRRPKPAPKKPQQIHKKGG